MSRYMVCNSLVHFAWRHVRGHGYHSVCAQAHILAAQIIFTTVKNEIIEMRQVQLIYLCQSIISIGTCTVEIYRRSQSEFEASAR